MDEMIRTNLIDLANRLVPISWSWNRNLWRGITDSLQIHLVEQSEYRVTYSLQNSYLLDAYFSDNTLEQLERIEVNLLVVRNPETLSETEYSNTIISLLNDYNDATNVINSIVGQPIAQYDADEESSTLPEDMDEYEALRASFWQLNNAILIVELSHQDTELPIMLNLCIEPSLVAPLS